MGTLLRGLYKNARFLQNARFITIQSERQVEIPNDQSFAEYLIGSFDQWPEFAAVIDATTGESCSYSQMTKMINNTAAAFLKRGLKREEVVCFISTNCIDYGVGMVGTNKAGGIFTGVNPLFTESELVFQLGDANVSIVATIPELLPKVESVAKQVKSIKTIYLMGSPSKSGLESISDLAQESHHEHPKVKVNPEDVASLFYSSGTTGRPKGTMLTNYNMISSVQSLTGGPSDHSMFTRNNTMIATIFPFFHIGGANSFFPALKTGNTVIIFRQFEFDNFLQTVQNYKAVATVVPPGVLTRLAKDPQVKKCDLSNLKTIYTGAAPVSPEIIRILQEDLNITEPRTVYGATEVTGVIYGIHTSQVSIAAEGSVGKIFANHQYKIADVETGKELDCGQTGEVWIKGPSIMKGYLNNPEATANAITKDGWLKTGDLGYAVEDGRLWVVDRLKDLIKCQDFQVAPAELEDVLLSHPAVAETGVIGMPDEKMGEVPRAFVILKAGMRATEKELQDYLKDKLAPYKQLRGGVIFLEELPRNASGKVLRRFLRELK